MTMTFLADILWLIIGWFVFLTTKDGMGHLWRKPLTSWGPFSFTYVILCVNLLFVTFLVFLGIPVPILSWFMFVCLLIFVMFNHTEPPPPRKGDSIIDKD